jgi:hypothetical protein
MHVKFGYRKVRYRGIAKNDAQLFSLLALANLYLRVTVEGAIFAKDARSEANHRQQHRVDQRFPS